MNPLALRARECHAKSIETSADAARWRLQRDQLVRRLRAEDPGEWSYSKLAAAVGCGPELIAKIVKERP